MRLQSHIWVAAFRMAEARDGCYCTVVRKGSPEAGAIFVVQNHLNGFSTVFSQAPQAVFVDEADLSRRFEKVLDQVPDEEITAWLDRQTSFDPDCWIVETERKNGDPKLMDG